MSLRKAGFFVAMTTIVLLSGTSVASARSHDFPDQFEHRRNGHGHRNGHGQKQCFHRFDGVRCFDR